MFTAQQNRVAGVLGVSRGLPTRCRSAGGTANAVPTRSTRTRPRPGEDVYAPPMNTHCTALEGWSSGGRHFASTYVRDTDGKRRRVERSSDKSIEDARRLLQRHLQQRRAPLDSGQIVTTRTTLAELFEIWIEAKAAEDGVADQSVDQYRRVWRTHGADQLGALRITELSTSQASRHLLGMGAMTQAKRLRRILSGMFSLAVRYDVLAVNPIRETKTTRTARKATRAATPAEFKQIRSAVNAYVNRERPGPRRGAHRLLPAFIECLAATGVRPNEVLAIEWPDVDLLADPPNVTVTGTLIDHGQIAGQPLHRQSHRKHGAPPIPSCSLSLVWRR
jgi:integrase